MALYASKTESGEKPSTSTISNFRIQGILIQPLDDVDEESISYIQHALADSLSVTVTMLPAQKMPATAWYSPRKRFWADSLLVWLKPFSANRNEKVLGITGKDISTKTVSQNNRGVMGLSYVPGNVCIISDYRLQQHGATAQQIREKLLKVALHELGHSAGLPHRKQPKCLMTDAEGKDKLDQQNHYCYSCRSILFGQ